MDNISRVINIFESEEDSNITAKLLAKAKEDPHFHFYALTPTGERKRFVFNKIDPSGTLYSYRDGLGTRASRITWGKDAIKNAQIQIIADKKKEKY